MTKCEYCKKRKGNACYAAFVTAACFFTGTHHTRYYAPNILNKNNSCEFFKPNIKYRIRKVFKGGNLKCQKIIKLKF